MKRLLVPAIALFALLLMLGSALACRVTLSHDGFTESEAAFHSLVFSSYLMLLMLPLIGISSSKSIAPLLAGALGALLGAIGFAVLFSVTIVGAIQAVCFCFVIALLLQQIVGCCAAFGAGQGSASAVGGLLYLLGMSSFFWSGPLAEGDVGKSIVTWGSFPVMLSVAYRDFNLAFLPAVYRNWLGPVVPYPRSIWIVLAGYCGVAVFIAILSYWVGSPQQSANDPEQH